MFKRKNVRKAEFSKQSPKVLKSRSFERWEGSKMCHISNIAIYSLFAAPTEPCIFSTQYEDEHVRA